MKKGLFFAAIIICVTTVLPVVCAGKEKKLGDESDGSRATPVHHIPLIGIADEDDQTGDVISPDDEPVLPFSQRVTCGECHSYNIIKQGWHFNAADANVPPGRVGQPWIFVDAATATQIPLSYRDWQGTYKPEQIGITTWQFAQLFGRHMPGGGAGEIDSDNPDEVMRSFVSGKLEVNCLACHNGNPHQDQAEYADQIARQNFRWAATAACEFASVAGSAKDMSETWSIYGAPPDDPKKVPPAVKYRQSAFDDKNKVLFDVGGKIQNESCYFCHSTAHLNSQDSKLHKLDEDVHLASGLDCIDCHTGGLEHNTSRGYETEACTSANPLAAGSSCKGCHLGEDNSQSPTAGRLGAPVPKHAGIPPIHFDKISCTGCHSGLWPEESAAKIKTSRAHALGTHNVNKKSEALPHIFSPVLAKGKDGKIAPHNLIWPAFWASVDGDKITPLPLETIKPVVSKILKKDKAVLSGNWPSLTNEQLEKILKAFSAKDKAAYVTGGRVYHLDDKGELTAHEHEQAEPYLWPIAHDVRPASQSLGVRRCEDCHATDAGFFFGKVAVDSPLVAIQDEFKEMVHYQDINKLYAKIFAFTYVFRPWLKIVALACCAVIGIILLLYGLKMLGFIAKIMVGKE